MVNNEYMPFRSEILEVIKHAELEYTFRMSYDRGDEHPVKPGQFFEISIPKYGEAPISVSGITDHSLDFTIRRVGSLTDEIFENYVGDYFFMRGPYGNGFDVNMFKGKEIILVAGGSGLSPIHGVIDYFADHMDECKKLTVIVVFKSPDDILFKEDQKRWAEKGISLITTVDHAPEGYTGHVGMVTKYIPDLTFEDMPNAISAADDQVLYPVIEENRLRRGKYLAVRIAQDVLRPGKMRSLPHRRHLYLPGRTGVQIYENQLDD